MQPSTRTTGSGSPLATPFASRALGRRRRTRARRRRPSSRVPRRYPPRRSTPRGARASRAPPPASSPRRAARGPPSGRGGSGLGRDTPRVGSRSLGRGGPRRIPARAGPPARAAAGSRRGGGVLEVGGLGHAPRRPRVRGRVPGGVVHRDGGGGAKARLLLGVSPVQARDLGGVLAAVGIHARLRRAHVVPLAQVEDDVLHGLQVVVVFLERGEVRLPPVVTAAEPRGGGGSGERRGRERGDETTRARGGGCGRREGGATRTST